jgi:hypothetical protein
VDLVLPGNRVEIQLPSGSEGQDVNVLIVLPTLPLTSSNLAAQLAQMAADPDIQSELSAIDSAFAIAQEEGYAFRFTKEGAAEFLERQQNAYGTPNRSSQ